MTPAFLIAIAVAANPSPAKVDPPAPERLIATERDLTARVKIAIDVPSRRAEHSYRFESAKDDPLELEVAVGAARAKAVRLGLRTRVAKEFREIEELPERMFGRTGGHLRLQPRVRLRANEGSARGALLIANYEFDFEVRLPPGARVLASRIPFRTEDPTRLRWTGAGLTVMPPIDVLYTLAEESVSLSKRTSENGRDVVVTVAVRNDGSRRVARVDLRAQFPRGAYEIDETESAGRFQIVDDQIVRWAAEVGPLDAGQTSELKMVLAKPSAAATAFDFEVFAYNAAGDLLATASSAR